MPSLIIFAVPAVFYVLAWVYIRQLVRDVNSAATDSRVSLWKWHRGWKRHRTLFPASVVRKRISGCIGLTVALGLIAFGIEARHLFYRVN